MELEGEGMYVLVTVESYVQEMMHLVVEALVKRMYPVRQVVHEEEVGQVLQLEMEHFVQVLVEASLV